MHRHIDREEEEEEEEERERSVGEDGQQSFSIPDFCALSK
jgi:hypothetical protein